MRPAYGYGFKRAAKVYIMYKWLSIIGSVIKKLNGTSNL